MNPTVSICLPCYNTAKFLPELLSSIEKQSYADWELIICDSHSNDGSAEILSKFAVKEKRATFYSIPKEGIYPGWNECIKKAKGDYIYIATSDDTLYPECLSITVDSMEKDKSLDLVHFKFDLIDADSNVIDGFYESMISTKYFGHWANTPHIRSGNNEVIRMLFMGCTYVSVTSILFRNNSTIRFPTDYESQGDYFFYLDYLINRKVLFLPETLATWRRHKDQATNHAIKNVYLLNKNLNNYLQNNSLPIKPSIISEALSFRDFFVRQAFFRKYGSIYAKRLFWLLHPKWGWKMIHSSLNSSCTNEVKLLREVIPNKDIQAFKL